MQWAQLLGAVRHIRGGADRHRATKRPTSTTPVYTRGPALVTAAVIPTTRSAAWKFDALRGKRLAQYRSWPNPPLRDKLRE